MGHDLGCIDRDWQIAGPMANTTSAGLHTLRSTKTLTSIKPRAFTVRGGSNSRCWMSSKVGIETLNLRWACVREKTSSLRFTIRKIFDQRFAGLFRFPAAGFYGGTIHIRGDTAVTDRLVRVLYHELVHAAFDAELPNTALPAWFNEGIAEWFEASATGQYKLSDRQKQALASRAREQQLFALSELSGTNLASLGPNAAGVGVPRVLRFYQLPGSRARRVTAARSLSTAHSNRRSAGFFAADLSQ